MCLPTATAADARAAVGQWNQSVAYWFTLWAGIARGVWSYSVLSGYLYVLMGNAGNPNFYVGLAEGVQGIAQCVVSLAAGWAADRFQRSRVCKAAAVVGVLSALGLASVVQAPGLSRYHRFLAVAWGLGAFGSYQGVWNTALETVFADSTKRGLERSAATTSKFALTLLATTAGPLLSIALFAWMGDDWTLAQLRTVMVVGLVLCAFPALLMARFRDGPGPQGPGAEDDGPAALGAVPYVVLASDLVSGFGSGMTVKFVPLFFKNRVGFSPAATNALYVASPLLMVAGAQWVFRLSRRVGRPRACAGCMALASLGLIGMAFLDLDAPLGADAGQMFAALFSGKGAGRSRRHPALAVALYLVTNAQHMCRPLKKSALMDFVPRQYRGKWNAVDGVTRFGWSGSAVLGGFLVDRDGYALTFLVTAVCNLAGAALWLTVIGVVDPAAPGFVVCGASVKPAPAEDALESPLLAAHPPDATHPRKRDGSLDDAASVVSDVLDAI